MPSSLTFQIQLSRNGSDTEGGYLETRENVIIEIDYLLLSDLITG
jgi:hypothetical protein